MTLWNSPRIVAPIAALVLSVILGGCLTAERKIMTFNLNPDGSGRGTILFYNLMSGEDDGSDQSLRDYNELVNTYLNGDKFRRQYPELLDLKTRIFEENNLLNGEVTFRFETIEDVGLYRYNGTGPYMYHVGSKSDIATERFQTSNGEFGSPRMPVIFWPDSTVEFRVVAAIDRPNASNRSLLPLYHHIGVRQP